MEGENDSTKFPMKDVAMIKTSDGEFTYPFDVPIISQPKYKYQGLSPVEKKVFIVCAGTCVGIIWLTYYIFFEHSRM